MAKKRRILLVEDHTLLRAGLCALLEQDPGLEIVGESDNGRDALRSIAQLNPDLVLMDLSMPGINGIEAIANIKRRHPEIRVLVLTVHKAEEYIHESLRAGADGYILKDATHAELRLAIHSVLDGKTYLSPDISSKVISSFLGNNKPANFGNNASSPWETLTHREREVLKLVAEGNTNRQIADYLCLSVKTVEKHRSNLMKKLDLHNASALTAYALEKGLCSFSPAGAQ
ncbi:MAG: two component transcriptional regulator, LuxR family [Proteobacteria bacterium]|nr:two component transcriptional regulator, LuxR family [Pseudomonadota bacterium]